MKIIKSFLFLTVILVFSSCDNFEEINTDPSRASETLPEYLLGNAEKEATDIMYNHYYNGRMGMQMAQYWMGTQHTTAGRFLFTDDGLWSKLYAGPLADLEEVVNYYEDNPSTTSAPMLAAVEVFKTWIFHVLTDVYVDVPYSQALKGGSITQPTFDTGESIYAAMLASLKTQIATLSSASGAIRGDIIMNGDKDRWIKFANALRLRIAIRMADVKAGEAQSVIEEASQNTLSAESEDIFFPYNESTVANRFPYNNVERPLVEFALTTTLIDYLKEVNDPRLPVYARVDETNGEYVGKEPGEELDEPTVIALSKPGSIIFSGSAKGYVSTYSEVAFILAEAAARGMNVGQSAEEWYVEAITASMNQWGISDEQVISDYLAGVPYGAGDWKDVIGTQKWLGLYSQGLQGWLERIRLDHNKPNGEPLFVAPVSGSLDPDVTMVPTRITYPTNSKVGNQTNTEAAASRIGGDTQASKNWWDIN